MTRDEQRAANRARFPEFAAMADKGWKLLHAEDANGAIGKLPADDPNWATVDLMKSPSLFEVASAAGSKRR